MSDAFKLKVSGSSSILFDATLIADPDPQLFDAEYQHAQSQTLSQALGQTNYHTNHPAQQKDSDAASPRSTGIGRAKVVFFEYESIPCVLKHYYRGGAMASLLRDRYIGSRAESSRAFREYQLLKQMQFMELPVPVAIAAHVKRSGLFYRCDLITREIQNSETLADFLIRDALTGEQWQQLGKVLRSFHHHDIYHADLNARNIMLKGDEIYLIDFDKGSILHDEKSWKQEVLARLHRSLMKFKAQQDRFCFDEHNWKRLLQGYDEA